MCWIVYYWLLYNIVEKFTKVIKNIKFLNKCKPIILIVIRLQVVGSWFNSLKMNLEQVVWHKNSTDPPTSACSLPCEPGKIKKQQVFFYLHSIVLPFIQNNDRSYYFYNFEPHTHKYVNWKKVSLNMQVL